MAREIFGPDYLPYRREKQMFLNHARLKFNDLHAFLSEASHSLRLEFIFLFYALRNGKFLKRGSFLALSSYNVYSHLQTLR